MFLTFPVETWNSTILGFDMPNYWRTFGAIVVNVLTYTLDDCVTDNILTRLIELFNYPPEEEDFILNHYVPTVIKT